MHNFGEICVKYYKNCKSYIALNNLANVPSKDNLKDKLHWETGLIKNSRKYLPENGSKAQIKKHKNSQPIQTPESGLEVLKKCKLSTVVDNWRHLHIMVIIS